MTHEFSLAPYAEFDHADAVWEHVDRLEHVQITDDDYESLSIEFDQIPTIGRPTNHGLWREGTTVIDPQGATVAARIFEAAAGRLADSRLRSVCIELAALARRASLGGHFIYHSGL